MPFKREGSPYWYVRPRLRGRRITAISTRSRSKRAAEAMEAMLRELPLMGHADLLEAILRKDVRIDEVYVARLHNALDSFREALNDPPIEELLADMERIRRPREGGVTPRFRDFVPDGARCSWVLEPKNLSAYYEHVVENGLKAATVHAQDSQLLNRAIDLRYGKARRLKLTAEVRRPKPGGMRDVRLSAEELSAILEGIRHAPSRQVVTLLVSTGVDLGPALKLTPRHILEDRGLLSVPDTKNRFRGRDIPVTKATFALLRAAAAGKGPDEPLFRVGGKYVYRVFKKAVRDIGRPEVRLKDLRHVFAAAYLESGGQIHDLRVILGHANIATTMRYLHRTTVEAERGSSAMSSVAEHIGLGRGDLRVVND